MQPLSCYLPAGRVWNWAARANGGGVRGALQPARCGARTDAGTQDTGVVEGHAAAEEARKVAAAASEAHAASLPRLVRRNERGYVFRQDAVQVGVAGMEPSGGRLEAHPRRVVEGVPASDRQQKAVNHGGQPFLSRRRRLPRHGQPGAPRLACSPFFPALPTGARVRAELASVRTLLPPLPPPTHTHVARREGERARKPRTHFALPPCKSRLTSHKDPLAERA